MGVWIKTQIQKINSAFPQLRSHLSSLVTTATAATAATITTTAMETITRTTIAAPMSVGFSVE